jgi:transcriptional regulator with XRE-family HTH domain
MAVLSVYDVHPNGAGASLPAVTPLPHMDGEVTFGEWVRRYRKLRRMTQEQLAEAADTDKGTISEIENKPQRKGPEHDLAQRIIAALDAPAVPFLKALGYPVEVPADWEARLMADDRIDEETKLAIALVIRRVLGEGT